MPDIRVPRFFIDAPSYYNAIGEIQSIDDSDGYFFNTTKGLSVDLATGNAQNSVYAGQTTFNHHRAVSSINYFAVLGHTFNNFSNNLVRFNMALDNIDADNNINNTHFIQDDPALNPITLYNCQGGISSGIGFEAENTGSSIVRTTNETITGTNEPITLFEGVDLTTADGEVRQIRFQLGENANDKFDTRFGGFSYGWTYTMPHAPDMSLSFDIEYDGYDVTTTKGGNTLTNIRWNNSPLLGFKPYHLWHEHGNEGVNMAETPTGRRVWNLKFSYFSRDDVFPMGADGTTKKRWSADDVSGMYFYNYDNVGLENEELQYLGLKHNFYTRVVNGTLGGALPFIFQPDSTIDDYAICRFEQNSFKFRQQAPDLYEVSVKIVETW